MPDPRITSVLVDSEEVGLKLRLTPIHIGLDSAEVNLDVWLRFPEEADAGASIPGTVQLRTRQVQTQVTLRDREPLILGGLTIRRCRKQRRGMPRPKEFAVLDPLHSALSGDGRDTEIVFLIRMRSASPGRMPAEMKPRVYRGWSTGKTKTDPFGRNR